VVGSEIKFPILISGRTNGEWLKYSRRLQVRSFVSIPFMQRIQNFTCGRRTYFTDESF